MSCTRRHEKNAEYQQGGTVYRNLNILAESGEIARLNMPIGPDHYDCQMQNHYHFLCRKCNRVLDTELLYDAKLNLATPAIPGCKTEWHRLILVGLCPDCSRLTDTDSEVDSKELSEK